MFVLSKNGHPIKSGFESEDLAMSYAQRCGYVRQAGEDEGGPEYGVLMPEFKITRQQNS